MPTIEPTATTKMMPTPKGQTRNEEVFRAAAQLMIQKGFAGTSMGDLAKAVGMTKAGLYHHINSKQDLLFQILLYALDVLNREVIAPTACIPDPEERLRQMIQRHVRGLFTHGLEFTLLFPERRHLETTQQEIISKKVDHYRGLLLKALQDLREEDKLRELDIHAASNHILQTIAGIARWYPERADMTEEVLVEQTVAFNISAILKP